MANKNIFDLIPANFFAPLSNGNRRLNFELLNILNQRMTDDIAQFSRDTVISWLEEYLMNTNFDMQFDDENNQDAEQVKSPHDMAISKLNYFTRCGWLTQETDKDFKVTYQMTSFAIDQLKLFTDTIEEDTRPLELTSYVYSIYSDLRDEDFKHSVDRMESIERNVSNLRNLLRGLNFRVKRFLSELLSNPNAKPNDILSALLIDYRNSVVLKGFTNLRSKDNPSKYKADILHSIDNLRGHMYDMVNNYLVVKCNGQDNEENRLEASAYFSGVLQKVEELFDNIEDMISKIDKKNTQYVSATFSRLEYLLNEEKDLEGRINQLFKEMQVTGYDGEDSFHLYKTGLIDDTNSLFQPRQHRTKVKYVMQPKPKEIDPTLIEENKKRLEEQLKFSVHEIDKYIMSLLKDKLSITAKEIPIDDYSQLMRVFLAVVYSVSPLVHYEIKLRDDEISWKGHTMNDFVIERRTRNGSSK